MQNIKYVTYIYVALGTLPQYVNLKKLTQACNRTHTLQTNSRTHMYTKRFLLSISRFIFPFWSEQEKFLQLF